MATLSIHELGRNTQRVISGVDNSGRPVIVPSHGAPVAAIVAIDSEELADIVLSTAPQYLDDLMAAERDMRAGRTVNAGEFFAQLEREASS